MTECSFFRTTYSYGHLYNRTAGKEEIKENRTTNTGFSTAGGQCE